MICTVEDGVAIHRVRRVGVEIAVVVLAPDLKRVLAPDQREIPASLVDLVANDLSSTAPPIA